MRLEAPYATGYRIERRAVKMLEDLGYIVVRSAGSHGPFDLVAISPDDIRLVQIKVMPFNANRTFFKQRLALKRIAVPLVCRKEFWIYEIRRGWHFYQC